MPSAHIDERPGSLLAQGAPSVVLTHHWLVRRRGGERVFEALRELFPQAPVYTLIHQPRGYPLDGMAPHTSWLQRLPGATRLYPQLLPLMPAAARAMRLPPADLVLCSDAALAKAMTADARSRVVCYCHSPMRYVWDLCAVYRASLPAPLRPVWGLVAARIRRADALAAQRVDLFIANSRHVAERIRRAYARESTVVYPPVDVPAAPALGAREDFHLCVGQHVAYKRLDLAVSACLRLGRRLIVIGEGPAVAVQKRRVEAAGAGDRIRFMGWQSDESVASHYRRARALLFPGEEDFGIVPVEAIAHGCPVVAYGVGGAAESVEPRMTGVLFDSQTEAGLIAAIEECERLTFDPALMHMRAQRFGRARFLAELRALL